MSEDEDSSDSGFGSSPETSSKVGQKLTCTKSRKRLFSKRKIIDDDTCPSPSSKRPAVCYQETIINALDRMSSQSLIGDASGVHSLPTIPGKHRDLPSIDASTLSALLQNGTNHTIIDCRYPYEFLGGHIQGAVNIYTEEGIRRFLSETTKSQILVFHCEFSSHRGPKL